MTPPSSSPLPPFFTSVRSSKAEEKLWLGETGRLGHNEGQSVFYVIRSISPRERTRLLAKPVGAFSCPYDWQGWTGGGEGQLCFASQRRSFPTRERGWSLRRCVGFLWQASPEKSRLQMKFCCKSFAKQMKITHIIVPKSVDWISRVGGQMLTIDDKGGGGVLKRPNLADIICEQPLMQIPLHHIIKRTCLTSW